MSSSSPLCTFILLIIVQKSRESEACRIMTFFLSLSVPGENAFHDLLFCVSFPETDVIERCFFEDKVVIILVRMP